MYWTWYLIMSIFSGVILTVITFMVGRGEKRAAKRAEATEKFNGFVLNSIKAIGGLAKANAIAIKRGESNGHTEAALEEYDTFRKELGEFIKRQAVKTI